MTLKNQMTLIQMNRSVTADSTTDFCQLRALIRASTIFKEITHAVAYTPKHHTPTSNHTRYYIQFVDACLQIVARL